MTCIFSDCHHMMLEAGWLHEVLSHKNRNVAVWNTPGLIIKSDPLLANGKLMLWNN